MTPSVKVRSRDETIREVGDDYVLQDGESLVAQLRSRAARGRHNQADRRVEMRPRYRAQDGDDHDQYVLAMADFGRIEFRSGGEHAEQRASSARR